MTEFKHPDHAHIFILKLWQEVLDEEHAHPQTEWRGKIQDVRNGETHYFRDWPTIVHFISNILPEIEDGRNHRPRKRVGRPVPSKKNGSGPIRPRLAGKS